MAFTRAAENLAGAKALTTAKQQIRAATILIILILQVVSTGEHGLQKVSSPTSLLHT
jgi:hypothetical protein